MTHNAVHQDGRLSAPPRTLSLFFLMIYVVRKWPYLHGHLLDQVPFVGIVKGNAVLWCPLQNEFPQHGPFLADFLGQAAGVDALVKTQQAQSKSYH